MTFTLGRRLAVLEARLAEPPPPAAGYDLAEWAALCRWLDSDREAAQLHFDLLRLAAEYATREDWDGSRLFEAVGCDPMAADLACRLEERLGTHEWRTT